MAKVLIIGAGGVGNVVVKKAASLPEVFSEILLASRTISKCEQISRQVSRPIRVAAVDADKTEEVIKLIKDFQPELLINVALPYQDLTLMDACLATGVNYLDTANYEPPTEAKYAYSYQWAYKPKFAAAGLTAVLGCGFDPGVTNAFCAYAAKHLFDEMETIDILDCNAGEHGHPFATNFNLEINIREITQKGRYWEAGRWVETEPLTVSQEFNFPDIGKRRAYLIYHEEMESLVQNIKGLQRIRFWMTFSDQYLTYLKVLQDVGLTRIDPIEFEGKSIIPLRFLKALLPEPSSLGSHYQGKTNIGCLITGKKDGRSRKVYISNTCDHQTAYQETGGQAITYTTGVPAVAGAEMVLTGPWRKAGVYNVEELDPDPFLEKVAAYGLPWSVERL